MNLSLVVGKFFQNSRSLFLTRSSLLYGEISKLNSRDKKIMIMRYGLYNQKELTQKEVAEIMGISQSYISRIEKKIISKIKCSQNNWYILFCMLHCNIGDGLWE